MTKQLKKAPCSILYNVAVALNIHSRSAAKYGLDAETLSKQYKIVKLRDKVRGRENNLSDKEISCQPVNSEDFASLISFLRKYDKIYEENLSEKEDYSAYECYIGNGGMVGFCIEKETREKCNIFSLIKGKGRELVEHAMFNYDCTGLENCMAETYHNYYKGRYDMIPHHWEENWDFPGDKEKSVYYGWILPKGILNAEEKAEMLILGEKSQYQAFPESVVANCEDKETLCVLSPRQKDIRDKAQAIVANIVKYNQIYRNKQEFVL